MQRSRLSRSRLVRGLAVVAAVAAVAVLSVSPASATDTTQPKVDRNGDGASDLALLRVNGSAFNWFWATFPGFAQDNFGDPSQDYPVAGDFDGDGINDPAVFRVSGNPSQWIIRLSTTACCLVVAFGDWDAHGDIPLTGDFDGDGRDDLAVWRPGTPASFIVRLASGGFQSHTFGDAAQGDIPFIADFNADNRSDIGVRRPSTSDDSTFFHFRLSNGVFPAPIHFGNEDDHLALGDYNGDNRSDIALVRELESNGNLRWFIALPGGVRQFDFGNADAGDHIIPADYNGDTITDPSVWRPGAPGRHFVSGPTGSPVISSAFGQSGDVPLITYRDACMNTQDCVD